MSLNGHKPGCVCPACRGHVAAEARLAAEAEAAATTRAVARVATWLAAQLARSSATGATGPDVLCRALGRDDAQRVLRMAGMDAGQVAASEPAVRQMNTTVFGSGWADPDHDPRVTAVMLRSGASWDEINQVRRQVAEEYEARRLERQARDDVYHGRTGDRAVRRQQERPVPLPGPGALPVADERGVPVQVSTVLHRWEDYPDHQPASG